jgi:thiosulfate/3-mercaptopyruvate sulfurtransferase
MQIGDLTLMFTTLITCAELQALQQTGAPLLLMDCTADLMNPNAAREAFVAGHLPGALHADLERDLSAHNGAEAVSGGRHPLPRREVFAQWLRQVGLRSDTQVVVYDRNGMNFCGRLWWMLQWAGHESVAVLDGGMTAWTADGGAVESGPAADRPPSDWALQPPLRELVTADDVLAHLDQPDQTLIDARAAPRYRGEVEPLDPVAGHIPGALNRPFALNVDAQGRFKPAATLRAEFETLLRGRDPASVVHQCGSGVSALPNMLAMEVAGFARTRLYAGSWSEWCSDPSRPVEKG